MSLTPGTRIGNYEVLDAIGAGGMGEVYRARDTRLDRVVAIKALPAAFVADAERLARFEREAKLLASLSHPNIAAIYGLEDAGGAPHLVLEFIDGETLATRLAAGPLGVRETLELCGQIAAAIEAAHDRGIVHRDLKPGNVMLVGGRVAKVLDFGLAKSGAPTDGLSRDLSASPTVAMTATVEGIVLGTASYMSPEQARGRAVDRRADVWAFGCVVYECLAARRVFAGETASDVIARILEREPDWGALPPSTPARLRDLVRRCLTKDPEQRPRDIGDIRRELAAIALDMTAAPVAAPAAAATPSLAVLYFENLANDPDSEYFCAGVTEDIITDLSKIKALRVASRNAVARYRGTQADLAAVARELGVGAVLVGSVRRAGDRVRISAQLVNGADGFQLWADRFDRTLEDVFAVQEEIASAIAEALRVTLSPSQVKALAQDRPDDVRAYDLYLKGRAKYAQYTTESLNEAIELFRQAIGVEADYALAWAGIADSYGQILSRSNSTDSEAGRLGLEAARRAIAINPRLAEAYKAEALVLRYMGDFAGSHAALERALDVNPRFVPALVNLGIDRFATGDLAGAERLIRRAWEIEPDGGFAPVWVLSIMYFTSRAHLADWDEWMERLRRVAAGHQLFTSMYYGLVANVALDRGDDAAAERAMRAAVAEGGDALQCRYIDAAIVLRRGDLDGARRIMAELAEVKTVLPGYSMPLVAAALAAGDVEFAESVFRRISGGFQTMVGRLHAGAHPLMSRPLWGPRQLDATLVWPLESPMIDPARFAMFREVKIASGLPEAEPLSAPHAVDPATRSAVG